MGRRWTSVSALLTCCAVTAGLALEGCAGGSAVSSVVDPVAQAAQVSELAPGFKVWISEEITTPASSTPVTASGTGVFDQQRKRGAVSVQLDSEGQSSTADVQYSDSSLYMHIPSLPASPLLRGKRWIKFDLRGAEAALGISSSALSSTSSDPRALLSYLRAAGAQATRIGTEPVRGVSTTHYHATIDFDRYAATVPPAQREAAGRSIAAVERLTGVHSQPVDVWIDGQDRVRREEFAIRECTPGATGPSQFHIKIEFSDYGIQAIPALPASNEVADLTSVVDEKLKHLKLGCA